jgi:meso-butanediol dehydrogenase/(S,S)-butanediol dehydrogenase/diacetyl reductase
VRFQDKVVVVTGAGSGIGKATALAFGREGAKMMAADIDLAAAQATAEQIKSADGQAEALQVDVSVAADVERMVTTAVERLGRLDVLVNNAGVFFQLPVVLAPEEQWDWLMSINLKGVFLGCKYAVPQMIREGKGAIVNTASIAGLRGFGGYGTYGAAKGGVVQLTKALAVEVARVGVRVNCVCPGIIETAMLDRGVAEMGLDRTAFVQLAGAAHPMGRIGRPEEVAAAILFLASDDASFITGIALSVDGGLWAGPPPMMPIA